MFSSLKHAIHKSLCDPDSQVFKAWDKGLDRISAFSKIPAAVLAVLKEIGAATLSLAVPIITLIIRLGIEWYCTHHKPKRVLEFR